jgi:branched-chain amino acid transport system substrate-binding protein
MSSPASTGRTCSSRKLIVDSGKIFVSTNAGPAELAGKLCAENIFFMRGQNDMAPMGLGNLLNKNGVKKIYAMAPNYAAGRDMVAGMERTFKGEVVGRDFTKWGDDPQLDFSAELAKVKASGADAIFSFYPGRTSAAFARQYDQSGLAPNVKLYSVFTLDQLALPSLQEAGLKNILGSIVTDWFAPDYDNPENKKFVAGFKAKYNRYPSDYAAGAYDLIPRLKAAIEQAGGTSDTAKLRTALRAVDYKSIFGKYTVSKNNFLVEPVFGMEVADDGGVWRLKGAEIVLKDTADAYVDECKMTN